MSEKYQSVKAGYIRLRNEFLAAYGSKCECCGETEPDFLTVDHIYGSSKRDRKTANGKYSKKSYEQLAAYRKAGWPKGVIRILCWNCNCARAKAWNLGICPHERNRLVLEGKWPPTDVIKSKSTTYSVENDFGQGKLPFC